MRKVNQITKSLVIIQFVGLVGVEALWRFYGKKATEPDKVNHMSRLYTRIKAHR